jgi:hypothetical protein
MNSIQRPMLVRNTPVETTVMSPLQTEKFEEMRRMNKDVMNE